MNALASQMNCLFKYCSSGSSLNADLFSFMSLTLKISLKWTIVLPRLNLYRQALHQSGNYHLFSLKVYARLSVISILQEHFLQINILAMSCFSEA